MTNAIKEEILHIPLLGKCIKKVNKKWKEHKQKVDWDATLELRNYALEFEQMDNKEWIEKRKEQTELYRRNPEVSIIILNRDGEEHLKRLMKSFEEKTFYPHFEIILADNASTDGSVMLMEQYQEKFPVTIIKNQENLSFSAANNQAVRKAQGEYLLFLNNDTEVTDGWLDELLMTAMEKENAGAVGARLYYPRIPEGCKNTAKSRNIQHDGIGFRDAYRNKTYFVQPYNQKNGLELLGRMSEESIKNRKPVKKGAVTAAVLLVTKKAFEKVGGFDEAYCYGYEDVDLCLKLDKAGYQNYLAPACMVFHYEFGTQGKDDEKEVKERRLHNMYIYQGKWQTYLQRKILKEKLEQKSVFTEASLLVTIVTEKKTPLDVRVFAESLMEDGYQVEYRKQEDEKDWYDIGRETDILILASESYDRSKIKNIKNDLIIWDWSEKRERLFTSTDAWKQMAEEKPEINPKKIDICAPMPDDENKKFWGDYHYALAMKKELEKLGYEVDVRPYQRWSDSSNSAITIALRGNRPYYPKEDVRQKNIMWNISHPADVPQEEYERFDLVYFASQKLCERWKDKLKTKCDVLLQCADPEVMKSIAGEKKYDLLFIGNSRRIYRQVVQDALTLDYPLTIYGRHWDAFPEAQACVKEPYMPNENVGQAYRDAKIVLNDHWEDMKETGIVSNRLFDALAAEAFIISDEMPEIEDIFRGTVVTYKDKEDLKEKADYYMKHPEEAEKLAKQGHQLVLEEHTFEKRMKKLVKDLEKI